MESRVRKDLSINYRVSRLSESTSEKYKIILSRNLNRIELITDLNPVKSKHWISRLRYYNPILLCIVLILGYGLKIIFNCHILLYFGCSSTHGSLLIVLRKLCISFLERCCGFIRVYLHLLSIIFL